MTALPSCSASARAGGATTSLDSGWDPLDEWAGGLDAALSATDVFLPNGAEARRIAGADDPEHALDRLSARVPTVAVKLGERGSHRPPGLRASRRNPTAGLGDRRYGSGRQLRRRVPPRRLGRTPLAEALSLAVACGTLSTRALGGVDAQPGLEEALMASAKSEARA